MRTPLPYPVALERLYHAAQGAREAVEAEDVHITDCLGRVAAKDHRSPFSTPRFDSSAMDGYAVVSDATKCATLENPLAFVIKKTIQAGDHEPCLLTLDRTDDMPPCVRVMTGAPFPVLDDMEDGKSFDACVKWEDTAQQPGARNDIILITKPVPAGMNKRHSGQDIKQGDVVLRAGTVIRSTHVMCLASVGITTVRVVRRPRCGIWSTGKELLTTQSPIPDVNGPYLSLATRELGADTGFLGILLDERSVLRQEIEITLLRGPWDVLLTSGGVSGGKYDFVREVLETLGATIIFHGLDIRPGHPVLFATFQRQTGQGLTAFFGLPGNPGAAAACFRFLVVPYIRRFMGRDIETPLSVCLEPGTTRLPNGRHSQKHAKCSSSTLDRFHHGILSRSAVGTMTVKPTSDQSPAKLNAFSFVNCWIHFKPEQDSEEGTLVDCYPTTSCNIIREA
ncbi:MoeA, N-terminal and linker domain-containing protein [Microdochium trichocladiopsis]|uniref:molybdopterin adenylyltransferase n=1 Tax=Microdochium trichocladiopsis TaxID=1682393 RepID=A0A9P8XY27_9PEZI|nr:MoeA, N-terminal and linker domain-containing protein [Microdochium trichocladiopsis]KAH7018597.1 MoeA, N-terminal and linker domain-containing protein [Microdochium trichocladiopsis]